MFVRHLSVADFRSYERAELPLGPGVTTLVGLNGQGKTNLVEAVGYLAMLGSHRVATDQPLVRFGAERGIVRAAVVRRDGDSTRETQVEIEITPGKANRARLGRNAVRPREVLGTLRTVLFAPEDLALVKGDPGERRRFLDDLLVQRQPRWAGVRSDVDKILRQRAALLKSAAPGLRGRGRGRRGGGQSNADTDPAADRESALHTLDVWDGQLARAAAPLLYARLRLLRDLRPRVEAAYGQVSAGRSEVGLTYRSSLREVTARRLGDGEVLEIEELHDELLTSLVEARPQEIERAVNLVGPHRDDLVLSLGGMPAKGYASHGESWSFALGLKLASYELLRHDLHDDPVLILDDVFAELDSGRRERLAELVADCEQVLVTAAVPEDIPLGLDGATYQVSLGMAPVAQVGEDGQGPTQTEQKETVDDGPADAPALDERERQ